MRIGVLALQGAFHEHQVMLEHLGVEVRQVRLPDHLDGLDGLILPGGESTTIGKLAVDYGLLEPIKAFALQHAMWGTCAGAIFMAQEVGRPQPLLGLMDIVIERNAFGRQVASFETDLNVPVLRHLNGGGQAYHAVFIRAPLIEAVHGKAESLAELPDGRIVAARQGRWLVTSFHPELTHDDRFHRYFLELVQSKFDR
jgi:5'-phosphate synthase pdxT subunit